MSTLGKMALYVVNLFRICDKVRTCGSHNQPASALNDGMMGKLLSY